MSILQYHNIEPENFGKKFNALSFLAASQPTTHIVENIYMRDCIIEGPISLRLSAVNQFQKCKFFEMGSFFCVDNKSSEKIIPGGIVEIRFVNFENCQFHNITLFGHERDYMKMKLANQKYGPNAFEITPLDTKTYH